MYKVRTYTPNDYELIKSWWIAVEGEAPPEVILPLDSTLILEINGKPSFCIIVYLTNCKEICYLEGLISCPDLKGEDRRDASQTMIEAACMFAKNLGYKKVVTFADVEKVKQRMIELGFTKTSDNLSMFLGGLS